MADDLHFIRFSEILKIAKTIYQSHTNILTCLISVGEDGVNWPLFYTKRYISKLKTHFCTLSTLAGVAYILLFWIVNLKGWDKCLYSNFGILKRSAERPNSPTSGVIWPGEWGYLAICCFEQGCGVDQISVTPTPTPTPAWKNRLRLQLRLQLRLRPTLVSFFHMSKSNVLKQWYLLCNAFDAKYCWQTRQQNSVKVCQDLVL